MSFVGKAAYLALEALAVWAIMLAVGGLFVFVASDFGRALESDLALFLWLGFAVYSFVTLPVAVVAATVGAFWVDGIAGNEFYRGVYAPWRPIAFFLHTKGGVSGTGDSFGKRETFTLTLPVDSSFDARTFLEALGAYCDRNGIAADTRGMLRVIDGRTKWQLRQGADDFTLDGWVEAPKAEDRNQICETLEQFASQPQSMAA